MGGYAAAATGDTNPFVALADLTSGAPLLVVVLVAVVVQGIAVNLTNVYDHAQRWITHLGNVTAPLTGAVLADYLLVKRTRIDVPELFEPHGRYRYLGGVNPAALAAGVAVYYAAPQSWVKVVWGIGVGAAVYLALVWALRSDRRVGAGAEAPTTIAARRLSR